MKIFLVVAFALCVTAKDYTSHIHVDEGCKKTIDFHLDALKAEDYLAVVRFGFLELAEENCLVQYNITVAEGQKLHFTMHRYTLGPKTDGQCQENYVQVSAGDITHKFCERYADETQKEFLQFTSDAPFLNLVYFQKQPGHLNLTMDFSVGAVIVGDESSTTFKCPKSDTDTPLFQCRTNVCLPMGLRCEKHANCAGGEDELDCENHPH